MNENMQRNNNKLVLTCHNKWKEQRKVKLNGFLRKTNTFDSCTCLLLLQQHHDFEDEHIVDHHFLVLVQDLKGFAADDIILDRRWKGQVGAWTSTTEI